MTDFWLSYPFMQRAVLAGLLLSVVAGYYGSFVVQRRMSFLGAGLAHAAFGGIALGLLLGAEPLWVALPFTAVVATLIHVLRSTRQISSDTAIGILFSVSVALGLLFLSMREGSPVDAFSYLFGSILGLGWLDVWLSVGLLAVALATLPRLWGRWAYASFDEEAARAQGVATGRDSFLLTLCVALTLVVSIKMVGILLVSAWLVIPAAAARLVAGSFGAMTAGAVLISTASTLAGLYISWLADLPSGAAVVLLQALMFLFAWIIHRTIC
ncbi:MAG: manganese transporter [Bacteroidetes bacterium CG12_big_fil_rev_8_21_14_0_65_60_17]|nr:MAG: manganese transporter [Bacteroidetes bacterium CG12_big_fil_rev_8_21_14_0_65_60_17]